MSACGQYQKPIKHASVEHVKSLFTVRLFRFPVSMPDQEVFEECFTVGGNPLFIK